jgi:signal peptidase I
MADREPAHRAERRHLPLWQESVLLLVLAVVVSVVVKAFLVQMFFVPSASMRPLFVQNDRILVEKVSYWTGDVQRGDVVVFKDPGARWLGIEGTAQLSPIQHLLAAIGLYPTGGHLVKRVIGVGGDHVRCCDKRGRITVNGFPLSESQYLRNGVSPSEQRFNVVVPQHHLWVMGDNRINSADSRAHQSLPGHGFVPVDDVTGKVWAIVWPWHNASMLHEPNTFHDPRLQTATLKQHRESHN